MDKEHKSYIWNQQSSFEIAKAIGYVVCMTGALSGPMPWLWVAGFLAITAASCYERKLETEHVVDTAERGMVAGISEEPGRND